MSDRLEDSSARYINAWTEATIRRPVAALVAVGALSLICALYVAFRLVLGMGADARFSAKLPFRSGVIAVEAAMPTLRPGTLVVVETDDAQRTNNSARALAGALRAHEQILGEVSLGRRDPFFDEHALLYVPTSSVSTLDERTQGAGGLLSALAEEPTLLRLVTLLEALYAEEPQAFSDEGGLSLTTHMLAASLEARAEGSPQRVAWESWLVPRTAPSQSRRAVLRIAPPAGTRPIQAAAAAIRIVPEVAETLGIGDDPGTRIRLTGEAVLRATEQERLLDAAVYALATTLAIVVGLLALGLGSIRLTVACSLALVCSLLWTAAVATAVFGRLGATSIAFANFVAGMGCTFGLHLCIYYAEIRGRGRKPAVALRAATNTLGGMLTLTAVVTAAAMATFTPTAYVAAGELAFLAAVGIVFSVVATLTLVPALVTLARGTTAWHTERDPPDIALPSLPSRYPGWVSLAAAAIALGACTYLPQVRITSEPLQSHYAEAAPVRALRDLVRSRGDSPWNAHGLAADETSAARIAQDLRDLATVGDTVTADDFLPQDQLTKLELYAQVSDSFDVAVAPEDFALDLPTSAAITTALSRMERRGGSEPLPIGLRRFFNALERTFVRVDETVDLDNLTEELENDLLGDLPDAVYELRGRIPEQALTVDDLPAAIVQRFVGSNGERRIEIVAEQDLGSASARTKFTTEIRQVWPQATGEVFGFVDGGRAVTRAAWQAGGGALLVALGLLWLWWRSLRDAALAVLPTVLAVLLTVATNVAAGRALTHVGVTALPLLIAIGVSGAIPVVRHGRGRTASQDILYTGTGRAVWFGSLATLAAWTSLALCGHPGLASLGLMLAIGTAYSLIANVLVLPALLVTLQGRQRVRPSRGLRR